MAGTLFALPGIADWMFKRAYADAARAPQAALIASRLTVTQQALTTLFGAAGIPGAYGADGNAVSLREGRQLAVA